MTRTIRLFFLITYYNRHFAVFLEELAKMEGVELQVGLLYPGKSFRPGYDQDKLINPEIYLKLFENPIALDRNFINSFDGIGLLGVFGDSRLYRTAILTILATNRPLFLFSERLRKRPGWKNLSRRIFLAPLNSSRVTFLGIGEGAYDTYAKLGGEKWSVRRFGFSVPEIRTENKSPSSGPLKCVYIGQLIERKRVGDVIAAFERVLENNVSASLTVIGHGPLRNVLSGKVKEAGMSHLVKFTGLVQPEELAQMINQFDCLLLPSKYDGWGAVVNEAMQSGMAIIVSEGVGARQIIMHDYNGYRHKIGDVDDLYQKIKILSENPGKLEVFKKRSLEMVADYTPATLAGRFSNVAYAKISGTKEKEFDTSLKKFR